MDIDQGALKLIGFKEKEAKILSYMIKNQRADSLQIEHDLMMHQPEVSISMKTLIINHNIIEFETQKQDTGRPKKIFILKKDAIIDYLITITNKKLNILQEEEENLFNFLEKLEKKR